MSPYGSKTKKKEKGKRIKKTAKILKKAFGKFREYLDELEWGNFDD